MIFVDYERGSTTFRAYDSVTHRVHMMRNVMFNEEG